MHASNVVCAVGGGEGLVPVSALKNICIDVMTLC